MAVTQVAICNSALVKVGAETISSITQESRQARVLNAIWDLSARETMRAHPWHFCKMRVTLAPNANTPAFGYDFEYDRPNDWLRWLDTDNLDVNFVDENGKLLSNEDTLDITYLYFNEDDSQWDSMFAEALSWYLAWKIAYALTQSNALVDRMAAGFKAALGEARSANGTEGMLRGLEADTWTKARL